MIQYQGTTTSLLQDVVVLNLPNPQHLGRRHPLQSLKVSDCLFVCLLFEEKMDHGNHHGRKVRKVEHDDDDDDDRTFEGGKVALFLSFGILKAT